jgi:hypothetical protein
VARLHGALAEKLGDPRLIVPESPKDALRLSSVHETDMVPESTAATALFRAGDRPCRIWFLTNVVLTSAG